MTEQIDQIPNPAYAPPASGIWSIAILRERCLAGLIPTVTFTPNDTVPVSWNGVEVLLTRGIEIEVPHMFYDLYRESQQMSMRAADNAFAVLKKRSFGEGQATIEMGWNGVDADHPR